MAEDRGRSPRVNPFQATVAVVLVAAVIVGYLVASQPGRPPSPDVVRPGDDLRVDYVALFENGRVFDTTIQTVAEDNATYPKAVSFQPRPVYQPFTFRVATPDEPGPPTVITGFERGFLEPVPMRVGETRQIVVSPELGYGVPEADLLEDRPLQVELPQQERMGTTAFVQAFDLDPVPGLTFTHPLWRWPVAVLEVSGSFVTLMHLPEPGFTFPIHGAWTARVVLVDSGADGGRGLVVVRHLLDAGHVDRVQAEDDRGTFRIVAVDREAGTYTVDYNREVVGKTLIFQVTLLGIDR